MTRTRPKPRDFEGVGLDDLEEEVYRALLHQPTAGASELAALISIPAKGLKATFASLEAKGLITRSAETPSARVPTPPDIAIDLLIRERQAELEAARRSAAGLAKEFRANQEKKGPLRLVEVVRGGEAVSQMFTALQRMATDQILGFDRPPYAAPSSVNPLEEELLARKIRYRVLYHPEALEQPGQPDCLQRCIAAGEEARVSPDLPMKMALVPSYQALLPLRPGEPAMQEALVVYPSSLLDALTLLFELLWERATPLTPAGEYEGSVPAATLSPDEQQLLMLLTVGLKDQVIARQLGVAGRTAERRVARLMHRLNAKSRFQAGVEAVRRGWIPPAG